MRPARAMVSPGSISAIGRHPSGVNSGCWPVAVIQRPEARATFTVGFTPPRTLSVMMSAAMTCRLARVCTPPVSGLRTTSPSMRTRPVTGSVISASPARANRSGCLVFTAMRPTITVRADIWPWMAASGPAPFPGSGIRPPGKYPHALLAVRPGDLHGDRGRLRNDDFLGFPEAGAVQHGAATRLRASLLRS